MTPAARLTALLSIVAALAAGVAVAQTAQAPDPSQAAVTSDATAPRPALVEPATPPVEPGLAASTFAPRQDVRCEDFEAQPGATWRAATSIALPGPQGPIRLAAGQIVSPGEYVSGLDLAAILQARCP